MKLRKKLIIFSILFLFGFGVFFGTFARGGYLVKAEDVIIYHDMGSWTYNYTNSMSGTPTTCEAKLQFVHDDEEGFQGYYFIIEFKNQLFDYNYEDYDINYNYEVYAFSDQTHILMDMGYVDQGVGMTLDEIYQYIDDDDIILNITFWLDGFDYFDKTSYINLDIDISNIFLERTQGSREIVFNNHFICLGYPLYNEIYENGYNIGLDEAYQPAYDEGYADGRVDGYDEGYALGETAGYNDGLDIGYYNGYEVGHYDGYTEGDAAGYSRGLDEGYDIGLDEGIQLSGYKEAYEAGIAKAENTATTWFKGIFNGLQGFLNIEIMGISIGTIILIPVAISFVWFIIRQFRGGGGGD